MFFIPVSFYATTALKWLWGNVIIARQTCFCCPTAERVSSPDAAGRSRIAILKVSANDIQCWCQIHTGIVTRTRLTTGLICSLYQVVRLLDRFRWSSDEIFPHVLGYNRQLGGASNVIIRQCKLIDYTRFSLIYHPVYCVQGLCLTDSLLLINVDGHLHRLSMQSCNTSHISAHTCKILI